LRDDRRVLELAPQPGDGDRARAGRHGVHRAAPGTIWLLAATMVLTVAVRTGAATATRCPSSAACPVDVTKLSLTWVQLGQAVVAVLGVLMVGTEYGALLAGGVLLSRRDA
jgi:ABC-2 type transport system permease protein